MDLMKFIEQAKKAYIKAYNAIDAETAKHNEKVQKYKQDAPKYTEEAAAELWKKIFTEHNETLLKINDDLQAELEQIESGFKNEVHAYYQPKGSELNEDDVKLLNSGLALSQDEIAEMVSQYGENTTMIRAIEGYVRKNKMKVNSRIEVAFTRAKKAGEAELRAFNSFNQLAGNAVKMALSGNAGTASYIASADKLEEYAKDTEIRFKKAKVFLDEATESELNEILRKELEEKSKTYSSSDIDYLH